MALGIDLGNFDTKVVELREINDKIEVINIKKQALFSDISKYDHEKINRSMWSSCVSEILKNIKISPKRNKGAVFGIPSSKSIIKHLITIDMDNNELTGALELEAKKHLAGANSDIIVDFHVMGNNNNEIDKIDVLLTATTSNEVQIINDIVTKIGIKSAVFNTDPVALINCFLANYNINQEGVNVIIHVGCTNTGLLVIGKDQQIFYREIDKGNDGFVRELMFNENIDYEKALDKILQSGINNSNKKQNDQNDADSYFKLSEHSMVTELIDDLRKTLRYYLKNNPNTFYNNFYLSGGSAQLSGLKELMEEKLQIKLEYLNPFKNCDYENLPDNYMQYTIAMGLAIRGLMN